MPAAVKKSSAKAPAKASATSKTPTHPSWAEMITVAWPGSFSVSLRRRSHPPFPQECIIAHPEDARGGVSRPMIKKFVESKYKVELNASAASQLNRAITSGSERGTFVLPKGPSGKVKLTPKVRGEATKENSKPVSKAKAPTANKATATKPKPAAAKPKPKAKATTATKATPKKATAAPKKALAGKAKAAPEKKTTAASKRAPAKKAVVGKKPTTVKKPTVKKATTTKKAAPKKASADKPKVKSLCQACLEPATAKKPASKKAAAAAPAKET
ncbi:hypothetical protein C8R43DRAFT_1142144 [Mycena crocata]|nr:hypothetical protein C8R43DRAFT_1142144 [Mycena crocata]